MTYVNVQLADGHHHEVRWSPWDLRNQLQLVREEGNLAGTTPIIEALVQTVTVTGWRRAESAIRRPA